MKKITLINILSLFFILCFATVSYGQCTHSICLNDTYGDGWGGYLSVSVEGSIVLSNLELSSGYGPDCYNFTASEGDEITITYSAGSWSSEEYYLIYNSSGGSGSVLYNSGSGSTPPSSTVVTANCSGITPPASDCMSAIPFCTSDAYTFPASTNVSSMGSVGCLYTTPNPAWYWMEIGSPGNIDIYMSSGGDVDFIAWGPFSSLQAACSSDLMSNSGVDCSYSTAATETANLTNTQTGQVYVLLITNYANITTNISFSQTSGAGSTNCGIIAPPITNNGPLCEGETLELLVTSPTTGATYFWSGPNGFTSSDMNPTISNVTTAYAGTYSLVITVGSETSPAVTTDVVINPGVTPTFTCGGTYCSGTSIPALPTTSSNGITGTWSPAINNTTTTTYTFTPTAGQCATNVDVTIEIDLLESEIISTTNQFCDAPGTATVSGINGTPNYTYLWPANAAGVNSGTASNLSAGEYTVTITDANGCQTTQNLSIGFTDNMSAIASLINHPACYGESNGAVTIIISNGTGPFNIVLDSTTLTSNTSNCALNNLYSGAYAAYITDVNGCQTTVNYTLTDPPELITNASFIQIACAGENATVTVSATGGTPSYIGTGTFEVSSGTHSYTVSDLNGCTSVVQVTIPVAPDPLSFEAIINNISCYDANDGSISIIASGGTPPIDYIWNDEISTAHISNLSPGYYNLTISDSNQCSRTASYTISEPEKINLLFTIENLLCYGLENGVVEMEASGGVVPYTYEIYNSIYRADGAFHNNLVANDYTISVRDAHNCLTTKNVNISSPADLTISVNIQNPSCIGNNDGHIEILAIGGTEPYSYLFEQTIAPESLISELIEGIYNIEVIDANSCSKQIDLITLSDNPVDCIKIPNAFTPNGDGVNDTWVIEGLERFPQSVIQVFNRWGQLMYYSTPDNKEWDARLNDQLVPAGNYVYFLNLFNGNDPYTGIVTVMH